MTPLLDVENLAITFRNRSGVHEVCSDVSFSVARGESVALVGESGSGKSVNVLAVTGLLGVGGSITEGHVRFKGADVTHLDGAARRRRGLRGGGMGVIFQNPSLALDPVFTIGQQLNEALRLTGEHSRAALRARGAEWLANVGLPDPAEQLDRYPHQLSGGQRQRAMIAIALASEPDLLIADEPTTALDVTIQAQVLLLIRKLQLDLNLGLLLVTHDFGVVSTMADKVVVMYAGQVVEAGSVSDLINAPQHPYTKALLACLPTGAHGERISALPGSVPTAREMPSGCRFHPRCPIALPDCRIHRPQLVQAGGGRLVRCPVIVPEAAA